MYPQLPTVLSDHAHLRSAQRNLDASEIAFITQHGRRVRRTGVVFCQLRKCDLPTHLPGGHRFRRLVGSTVVLSKDGVCVLTVYRNERAFRRDLRKQKYERRQQRRFKEGWVW